MNEVIERARATGEMAVFELFAATQAKKVAPIEDAERVAYVQRKIALAEELGLTAQTGILRRDLQRAERAVLDASPLTHDEYMIWCEFLPTAYNFGAKAHEYWSGRNYEYDRIPMPVLEKWLACRKEGLYDAYEIRTPEIKNVDPILLGIRDGHYYMLARWAESDVNLITFAGIKRKLVWNQLGTSVIALSMVMLIVMLVLSGGYGLGGSDAASAFARFKEAYRFLLLPAMLIGMTWGLLVGWNRAMTTIVRDTRAKMFQN